MGSQDVQCSPSLLVGASFLFMTFPRKVLPVLISSLYSRESSYRISFQALLFPSILSLTRKQRIRIHLRIVFVGAVSTTYGAEGFPVSVSLCATRFSEWLILEDLDGEIWILFPFLVTSVNGFGPLGIYYHPSRACPRSV